MKQFYLFIALLLGYLSFSQNFTDTKGELQISASGTATYTLPIAIPPSIKNVAPTVNLNYSSGMRGGIAGQGWSVSGVSAISRIATRRDIDGFVDGVDFDDNDKLALDGQRLLLKTGTYWASGSTYETEYKSNTKIELLIEGSTTYFIVTAPDGSRSWYGSKGSGSLQNSVSVNSWYIVHYEDVNGNFIDYNYKTISNHLYIDNITFSGNTPSGIAAQNQIKFNYAWNKRTERDFIKGGPVYVTQILQNIEVSTNNMLFRKYTLDNQAEDSFGYQRVKSIQESNGQGELSNPVEFVYNTTPATTTRTEKDYTNNLAFDKVDATGDFDGDGRLDFVADNKIFTNLFNGNTGNTPINLPFTADKRQLLTAATLTNAKLNQFQSIVYADESLNSIAFKTYNLTSGSVVPNYTKTINFNNTLYHDESLDSYNVYYDTFITTSTNNCYDGISIKKSNEYLEGDFNGDGISELLISSTKNERSFNSEVYYSNWNGGDGYWCETNITSDGKDFYLLNLDPNASTTLGEKGYVQLVTSSSYFDGVKYVADFNGDGKSDVLVINSNNFYRILSFKELSQAPWIETEELGQGTLDKYSPTKQILFGDYNGDGKTDIMLPDTEGGEGQTLWHTYYSNQKPAGGDFFVKESRDIVEYRPDSGGDYTTQRHYSNYYSIDVNKDGKSDIVRVWRKYYNTNWWDPKNHDTSWQVTAFTNNIGRVSGSSYTQTYDSGIFGSGSPDIPIPITSNYRYQGANTELIIVRGHYNKIEFYQFNKNVDTDNRLKSVTESSGNIKQTIDYLAMEATDGMYGNSSTDFYSSGNTVNYPNIEIIRNSQSYLVSKLTATINGVSKYQDFRYRGYVSNFNYGTVGFIRTTRSSWYLTDSDTKIWTTQNNDVSLRGANTITWNSTNGSTVFDSTPSALLSTKTNFFDVYSKGGNTPSTANVQNNITIVDPVVTNQGYKASNTITALSAVNNDVTVNYQASQVILKDGFSVKPGSNGSFRAFPFAANESAPPATNSSVYNVLLTKQTVEDHDSGIKNETVFTYDGTVDSPSYYGLEIKNVSRQYSGATLQGTTTVDTQYDSNPTGSGNAYYIGRPKKVNTSKYNVASGDTRTSEEAYTYTGSNLTKTEKKGHNTYALVEDMTYDGVGNLLTKTVSAPGGTPAVAARTITDEYDASKRFVAKVTDHQGLITNLVYNSLGQVTQSTDHMGVVSDFTYDNWGKLLTTTVTNAAAVPLTTTLVYAKLSTGGYTVTSTNSLDAKTVSEYDVLGRVVKSSTKGFAANSMVSKQIVYDGLGRKEKESEPYFSTPSLWTKYEYDYLLRPTKITAPTEKIQTLSYSGLTTTSNDDGKTTTATVDALGNKVQTTDPGGAINFTYFANGQLKESDYQGNKITIDIDGWGNKVKMTDPSAGTYTYSYDAFGQLKTETTPNGTTSFVYDDAGRQTEKTIVWTNTDSKTVYAYNSVNQITSSTFTDNKEAKTTTNSYEYDNLKRLFKTTETTPYAIFVKQISFDSLGRVDKETSTATASGKTSSKTVKNTYLNGFPWQILDDGTQQVLWQANSLNERGQLLTASLGNGVAVINTYDQYGYATQIKHDKTSTSVNVMTLNMDFEIKKGNLNSRSNSLFNRNETFKYDNLDRLTEYTNALGIQETQVYDNKGRITQNSIGDYEYDGTKTYQNKAITPTPEAKGYYGMREGIFNDSMEDRTGWTISDPYISFDKTVAAHTGNTSLKITNVAGVSERVILSDTWTKIDNTAPTQYTYSAWVKSDGPQAELFLFMKSETEQGYFTYVNSTVTNVVNQWTQITGTFTVPANIKKLNIRLDNNGVGNVWFDDVQIRKTSDAPTTTRALNITYNTFKAPVQIEETGVDKISFTYNDGNDRSSMFYGGLQDDKLARTYQKHYSADGTMEVKLNTVTGVVEFVTYIGGDGYSAPIVVKSDGTTQNNLYLHRDYQGTITAISDQNGAVVEKRLFDAWGTIVKVQDGAGNILAGLTVLDRGYTGHEHLQSVGIIHMNGRLYDSRLHRFLQPDNFVQDPENTQNYDRYSYVLNNPLKYIDPSGEAGIYPNEQEPSWNDGHMKYGFTIDAAGWERLKGDFNRFAGHVGDWSRDGWNGIKNGWDSLKQRTKGWFKTSENQKAVNLPQFLASSSNSISNSFSPSVHGINHGDIHMPTQHNLSVGGVNLVNWTYLSEGKPLSRFIYSTANGVNIVGQYFMGRSVGDGTMRNLNGSSTTTGDGVMGFTDTAMNVLFLAQLRMALIEMRAAKGVLNPNEIHFMQSSIKNTTGEFTVLGNAEALANGSLNPDVLRMNVWRDVNGKIWTLDHRRLGAFRLSGLQQAPIQWANPVDQMWKMTTTNGGISIKLKLGGGNYMIIK